MRWRGTDARRIVMLWRREAEIDRATQKWSDEKAGLAQIQTELEGALVVNKERARQHGMSLMGRALWRWQQAAMASCYVR